MPLGLAFWILMLLWLAFMLWHGYPFTFMFGGNLLLFVLIGILGYHAFGSPIHG